MIFLHAFFPDLPPFDGVGLSNNAGLNDEVESVLKTLLNGKLTGPDEINNCILSNYSITP